MTLILILQVLQASACSVKTGNPHPTTKNKENPEAINDASINPTRLALYMNSTATNGFERVLLNLSGVQLIPASLNEQTQTMTASNAITIDASNFDSRIVLLNKPTSFSGDYSAIRLLFRKDIAGEITAANQQAPIVFQAGREYIDIVQNISITEGKLTRVNFSLDLSKHFQATTNSTTGDVDEWLMGGEVTEADVVAADIVDEAPSLSNPSALRWRLVINKVNKGDQLKMNSMRVQIDQKFLANRISSEYGKIGDYPVRIRNNGEDTAWRIFSEDHNFHTDPFFDENGQAPEGQPFTVVMVFDQEVSITGFVISSHAGNGCPESYHLEARINDVYQEVLGSRSDIIACNPVSISW